MGIFIAIAQGYSKISMKQISAADQTLIGEAPYTFLCVGRPVLIQYWGVMKIKGGCSYSISGRGCQNC